MESNEKIERTYYNSRYRFGVDAKRRVQIPSKWRPTESGTELTLVVWPKAREGLFWRVLPPAKMDELVGEIVAMPSSDLNKPVLKRFIGGESIQVAGGPAGRVCLPEERGRGGGVPKAAVLVGMLDQFEIWSPERFEKMKVYDEVM